MQPPLSSNSLTDVLMAAPIGVGQPRKACAIERSAARVWPAACQPARARDEPDRKPVEIDAFGRTQLLGIVERVLHKAGERAVIGRGCDDDAVASAVQLDQALPFRRARH